MFIPGKIIIKKINEEEVLLVNSLAGTIDIVSKETGDILAGRDPAAVNTLDAELEKKLIAHGHLYKRREEYLRFYDNLYREVDEVILPLSPAVFEIELNHGSAIISAGAAEAFLQSCRQFTESRKTTTKQDNVFQVRIQEGNDAALIPALVVLLEKFRAAQLKTQVTLYPGHLPLLISTLAAHRESLSLVQITVTNTGSLESLYTPIRELLAWPVLVNIKLLLSDNGDLMEETAAYCRGQELDNNVSFSVLFSRARSLPDYRYLLPETEYLKKLNRIFKQDNAKCNTYAVHDLKLLSFLKGIFEGNTFSMKIYPHFAYCDAVQGLFRGFGADGLLYPCYRSYGIKELAAGAYFPLMERDKAKEELWEKRKTCHIAKCRECEIELFCGGGCPLAGWVVNRDINDYPWCSEARAVVHQYLDNYIAEGNL